MTIQSRKVTLITLFLLLAGAPNTLFISQESYAGTNKKKTPSQKKSGSDNRFEPGVIIVKMKSQQTLAKTAHPAAIASIAKKIQANGITSIQQTFLNSHGRNAEILHNIYSLHFSPTQNPEEIAARFAADPNIEYAEPQRIHKILETPNDELYNNQTYTDAIAIEAAWDITKGEQGDVVIAIVDGGTDWQHPDLIDNIWTNEDEIAGNNIDDDGNGYIDDVHGWNYATNSNDPTGLSSQPTNRNHGTHTAGIAGARVNNGIGVAGMSWNCKIMPICVAGQNDWDLSNTYQGVVYAVENGADIISCSWGKPGTASIFEQDVIDYANANGSLVVAAAGNTNSNNDYNPYYPALYNYVISVGSTTDKDDKALHSNYGWSVDVFAPGMAVYSTLHGGNYGANDGTSMACPIVSGIAGLLKTKNPELTPSEIEEYIRQTADRVVFTDAVSNSMIAKGRINAHSVLSAEALTAVRMLEATFIDEDGSGIINDGENIELNLVFKNILQATNPMQIILRSPSLEIDIIDSVATLKPLAKGDTAHVSFTYHVASGTPDNRTIYLFTEIEGENYSEHEVMRFQVNPPTYLDHNSGTLLTSITTSGNLGYIGFADEGNGSGFTFKGQNSLFEAGLMVGISESQVSNCIRTTNGARNNDFTLAQGTNMAIDIPGVEADEHGILTLVDSLADNPIGVQIQQDSYIYYDEPFNDFMIVKYTITNLNTTAISNLYAGIFVDWDVTDTAQDFAGFSAQHNLGWVQNTQNQPTQLSGTMLLSPEAGFGYHAISNELWIYDAFTEQEKWAFLTQPTSAEVPNYIDISTVVSAGPMNIEAGASKVVAFALVAGTSELDIKNNAESAQLLWDNELFIPKDNTPPQTTTSVLLNPLNSKYANITVISDKSLARPPQVSMIKQQDTTAITMSRIPGLTTAFNGTHEFDAIGIYHVMTSAQPKYGVDTTVVREFTLSSFTPGTATTITSTNGDYLLLPAGGLDHETFVLSENIDENDEPVLNFSPQLTLAAPCQLTLHIDTNQFPDMHVAIYQKNGETWERRETTVDVENQIAHTEIEMLGSFKLQSESATNVSGNVPTSFLLEQNYPNPFNPKTRINYTIAKATSVEISVYNALGQKVNTLFAGKQEAGNYSVMWDGTNSAQQVMPSGLYFYKLSSPEMTLVRKMVLLR